MFKWIIVSVICLIILGNLGIDVKKAIDSKVAQSNVQYAKNIVIFIWDKYLEQPLKFLWNEIFVKYVWGIAKDSLDSKLKGREMELNKEEAFAPSGALFFI
jgi:hypothetical protein